MNEACLDVKSVSDLVAPGADVAALAARYRAAPPYPHIVIDNFLKPEVALAMAQKFPALSDMPTLFDEPMSLKAQLSDVDGKWPAFSAAFAVFQSAAFRELVSGITGIGSLECDPILAGGGLHQSPRSGFLDLHVDANFHPKDKTLHRRINLLIYLNPQWRDEWGGQFEIWSDGGRKPKARIQSIAPVFNRAVIFSTTRTSWHGVAPMTCPEGETRKSVALYYYTKSRPRAEIYPDSSVIWMNRTVPWKRALYPAMNLGVAILKPYAKQVRALLGREVFDAADDRTTESNPSSATNTPSDAR